MEKVTYLGDGAYAEWNKLGDGGITLMANSHLEPTDTVHLEPKVLESLLDFVKRIKEE